MDILEATMDRLRLVNAVGTAKIVNHVGRYLCLPDRVSGSEPHLILAVLWADDLFDGCESGLL